MRPPQPAMNRAYDQTARYMSMIVTEWDLNEQGGSLSLPPPLLRHTRVCGLDCEFWSSKHKEHYSTQPLKHFD